MHNRKPIQLNEFDIHNKKDVSDRIYLFTRKAAESHSEAERATFTRALEKLQQQLKDAGIADSGPRAKPQYKAKPEPKPKSNSSSQPTAGQFKVVFVGHYTMGTSDKIWGWGVKNDTIYQFWGRYGGTPQLKTLPATSENLAKLNKLSKNKETKGYEKSTVANFDTWLLKVLNTHPKFTESKLFETMVWPENFQ